jgi:7-cyano-7-deazaguanine reductase
MSNVIDSPLGKTSSYQAEYSPDLLFPIPRKGKRDEIHVPASLPFSGCDVWNGFEISWLNMKGKPEVAIGEFIFPCTSPNIIESKSFKLYLNSFNNSHFASIADVALAMEKDLSLAAGEAVTVNLVLVADFSLQPLEKFAGINLDLQDISCNTYLVNPDFLTTEAELTEEVVCSDILKSNCLVTGQPDWASIQIHYQGSKINHAGLLRYLVSYRDHNEFHEQCVERIFMDILTFCQPRALTVDARYTRRGGLDINPFRSTETNITPRTMRLARQ